MSAALLPIDARTTPPTHPRWAPVSGAPFPRDAHPTDPSDTAPSYVADTRTDWDTAEKDVYDDSEELQCAAPTAWEQFQRGDGIDDSASADSDEMRCAALTRAAQVISDIHAQLALAYAYALTFRRAVRDYIPPDDQDILPCLSIGVLDVLDLQLPRLDALLDHLTRHAAGAAHGTHCVGAGSHGALPRHSRRERGVDDPRPVFGIVHPPAAPEAVLGGRAVRSTP